MNADMPEQARDERAYRRWLKAELFRRAGCEGRRGQRAPCAFGCGTVLTFTTATLDRYPIPGRDGGTYHIDNVRLACRSCNSGDGAVNSRASSVTAGMTRAQRRRWKRETRRHGVAVRLLRDEVFGAETLGRAMSPPRGSMAT